MKNFDIKKILNDFTQMFKSSDNVKLILALVLVVFILLFTVFGGCNGCGCNGCIDVSCHSCGGSGEKTPDSNSDSKDEKPIYFYEDSEIGYMPVGVEEDDVVLTFYYPSDIFSYTENAEEFWADWGTAGMLYSEGKFAVECEFDYVYNGWNSITETVPATSEEAMEAHRVNAISQSDPIGTVNVGGKDCLWRVYNGIVTVYVPFDNNDQIYAKLYVVPANYDPSDNKANFKAVELIYNAEVRAILSAVKPGNLSSISDDTSGVKFGAVPFADTEEIGTKLSWSSLGGTVHKVDQTVENGSYRLRLDSIEIAQDADGQNIVAFNMEFINESDKTICLNDAFYFCGTQSYGLDLVSNMDITGTYIPVAPGRCIAYQETYVLDSPDSNIYLEVINFVEENGTIYYSDESIYIDAYIVE